MFTAAIALSQALQAQKLVDNEAYTEDFKNKVRGKGREGDKDFPENDRVKRCAKILSQVCKHLLSVVYLFFYFSN